MCVILDVDDGDAPLDRLLVGEAELVKLEESLIVGVTDGVPDGDAVAVGVAEDPILRVRVDDGVLVRDRDGVADLVVDFGGELDGDGVTLLIS